MFSFPDFPSFAPFVMTKAEGACVLTKWYRRRRDGSGFRVGPSGSEKDIVGRRLPLPDTDCSRVGLN